jgi:hypothetical protein
MSAASGPIDRHTPIGWFNFAASYHAAADLIANQGQKATHPESPAMFLYFHAIELYLKSFLRLRGDSAAALRRIGHDFQRLQTRAEARGLVLGDVEQEVFDLLKATDIWSRGRYLKTGPLRVPTLMALSQTSRSLRQLTAKALREAGQIIRSPSHRMPRR